MLHLNPQIHSLMDPLCSPFTEKADLKWYNIFSWKQRWTCYPDNSIIYIYILPQWKSGLSLYRRWLVCSRSQRIWTFLLKSCSNWLGPEQGARALPDLRTPREPKAVIFQIAEGILIKTSKTKPQSHTWKDTATEIEYQMGPVNCLLDQWMMRASLCKYSVHSFAGEHYRNRVIAIKTNEEKM